MKSWPVLLLLIFLVIVPASSYVSSDFTITVNKTGSSFIWWSWELKDDTNLTKTVFVDNSLKISNTTLNHYIASDLNPNEQHTITLFLFNITQNSYNGSYTSTSKTYEQDLWLPLYITLALIAIGWFTAPLLIYVGIIPAFYGLQFAYLQTQQSYIVFLYGFMMIFTILAAALRTLWR